ncbi:hypothetical protein [Clostridium akagii]|uniref:hypothetical protein n=1 Tax=Clostridium akagii TaxID=91623 RepID=UPI00047A6D22|nr:hypothetical protein [Clostridium akagii]
MNEEMKKKIKDEVKKNYIESLKVVGLSLVGIIALIIIGFVALPMDAASIFAGILFVVWFIFIIVYSIKNRKRVNAMNKEMEEKYNSGEITLEEYNEFIKTESKAKNFIYIILIIIFGIKLLGQLLK